MLVLVGGVVGVGKGRMVLARWWVVEARDFLQGGLPGMTLGLQQQTPQAWAWGSSWENRSVTGDISRGCSFRSFSLLKLRPPQTQMQFQIVPQSPMKVTVIVREEQGVWNQRPSSNPAPAPVPAPGCLHCYRHATHLTSLSEPPFSCLKNKWSWEPSRKIIGRA